jgi:ATP-dependent RNA helicase DeaD
MDENISFEDLGLDEVTLAAVAKKGFTEPSPIQVLAIPRLLEGETNLIAKARTGTGKTAAFGLPLVQTIREETGNVQALILAPTRELAMQVCREIDSFTTNGFPRIITVYGGASIGTQLRELKRGVEIVVGTPGRVKDLMHRRALNIDHISYFILDEADEMLDMGFVDDIKQIFSQANSASRILLFSATMPKPILEIASEFMGDYDIVEEEARPEEPLLTEQYYWVVREQEKIEALVRLIDISPDFYGLVFTQTKSDADRIARSLDERGYEAAAMHGDIPQGQREKILARFRVKKTRILVATDVAARGIDIEGLTHVVNYSLPFDGATYVHRIGRTGRAGSTGLAYTFVNPSERRRLESLKRTSRKATKGELTEANIPTVKEVLKVKQDRLFAELKKSLGLFPAEKVELTTDDTSVTIASTDVATTVADIGDNVKIDEYFVSLVDDICKTQDAKKVLAIVLQKEMGQELDVTRYGSVSSNDGKNDNSSREGQLRVYVQLGRRDGYYPREIAQFFSDLLNVPNRMIDRIDCATNFSLVNLPEEVAKRAIGLSEGDPKIPHMHIDTNGDSGRRGSSDRQDSSERRGGGRRPDSRGRRDDRNNGRGRRDDSRGRRDDSRGGVRDVRESPATDSGRDNRHSSDDRKRNDRNRSSRREKGSITGAARRPDAEKGRYNAKRSDSNSNASSFIKK